MPLANYIVEFIEMHPADAIARVKDGFYKASELESLSRNEKRIAVASAINEALPKNMKLTAGPKKKPTAKKQMPGWMADFQHARSDLDQIKLIGRGAFTRKQLVEMTQYSQLGTVLTEIWRQITCDLNVGDATYRFHDGIDGYVIKRRTFGPDGNSYGGWSFHEKFPHSRAGKESALEAWIDLAAEGNDWNERGADAGTINPGGDVEEIETDKESEPMAKKIGMQAIDEMIENHAVAVVEKGKCNTMLQMQDVAEHVNDKFERYQVVEKEATMLMLEIGLSIEYVKEQLPHGQLIKWIESNLTISRMHAHRFRQLAQVFVKSNNLKPDECFMLCDPANSKEALGDKLRQMAFDFLGDKTQAELFEQYKIKCNEVARAEPKPLHLPKPKPLEPGETQAHRDATEAIYPMMFQLHKLLIGDERCVQHLDMKELKVLQGDLIDAKRIVDGLIKAG